MDDIGSSFVQQSIIEANPAWFFKDLDRALLTCARNSGTARSMLLDLAASKLFATPIDLSDKQRLRDQLIHWLVQPKSLLESHIIHLGAVVMSPIIRSQIQRLQAKLWRQLLQESYAEVIKLCTEVEASQIKGALVAQVKPLQHDLIVGDQAGECSVEALHHLLFNIGAHELYRFVLDHAPLLADRLKLLIHPDDFNPDWLPLMSSETINRVIEPWLGNVNESGIQMAGNAI